MCIDSIPLRITRTVKTLEPQHRPDDPLDGPMVLFDHVVQVPDLTDLDGRFVLGIDRVQRGQIGAAFVDDHRLVHTILNDRIFKEAPSCHLVAPGSEQEISGFSHLAHCPVEILPLAFDFDIRSSMRQLLPTGSLYLETYSRTPAPI